MQRERKTSPLRILQGVIDLHAPFLVDSVIWRDIVLADPPEHELLLEACTNPDLLACSTDHILSICSTELLSCHQLEYRSCQYWDAQGNWGWWSH